MKHTKIITYIFTVSTLLSSCDIFGGGGEKKLEAGEVVWRDVNSEGFTISTQPAIDADKVYLIQNARIKAFSLSDGKEIWQHKICQTGAECDYSRKIIYSQNKVFYDQGYNIKAFNKETGRMVWKTHVTSISNETSGIGSPVMSHDEMYLYAGRKGYVMKLRKSNGQIVRRFELERLKPKGVMQGSTNPIISPFGDNILYVPTGWYDASAPVGEKFGANLFAFDAATGELIWETKVEYWIDNYITDKPGDSLLVGPPIYDIAVTETSIVALQGKAIVAFNRNNGKIKWFKNFPKSGFDVGLSVKNGSIYAASNGHYAYRLDIESGEVVWKRNILYSNTSITTVKKGRLYFNNSGGGAIWVLDTKDGSIIYRELPPNFKNDSYDVYISSLAVGEGYMVNVGSKAVYCLTVP